MLDLLRAVRQNHAIEHATIAVLLRRLGAGPSLVGGSTPGGFYVYGDVPTDMVRESAIEGLALLQKGEVDLAVSPFCGTNIVVAGILTGLSAAAALGNRNRVSRLPSVVLAAVGAILLARPLGGLVQKHFTTDAKVGNVAIGQVTRTKKGKWTLHRVEVTR
ncbi:MAG: hypothetical protein HYX92_02035 [Chloroflexi bacterium]|nr:hypothetical protein [Chloroflexota bacterium]